MDLVRHLEYFTAVAQEQHFGQAAQRLGMRQPPLSQGLKRLEAELGVRLCDRDSRGVTLTDAGRTLLPAAHRVLDEVEQLRLLARRQDESVRPRLSVRVAPGLGARHYAALVAACRRSVPDTDVDVTEQATADQARDLLQGRTDVGILREPMAVRDLSLGPRVSVPLNALVPADHPAAAAPIRLRDLGGYPLVTLPREHAPAAHDDIVTTCERHGFLPEAVVGVADDRLARGLVGSGAYVGLTTDPPGPDSGDGVVTVPIEDQPLSVQFRLAWRGDQRPPLDRLPSAVVGALVRLDSADSPSFPRRRPPAASELPA